MLGNGCEPARAKHTLRERARGLVRLTRPGNAIAATVLTGIGAFTGGGLLEHPLQALAALAATAVATGAGNAINDYFDREIDRINRPGRPIPSGRVAPREAIAFSVFLFVLAMVVALALPLAAIAIAVLDLVALITYTKLFKGRPGVGNAVVAALTGSTFLFGGTAVGALTSPVVVLFALAALATFAREVVKDVEDVVGDREEGLRTLPIAIGERSALLVGTVFLMFAVLASPLPYLQGTFGVAYLLVVLPADAVMLYGAYESFADPSAGQARLKTGTFVAAAAFVLGRLGTFV